MLYLFKNKEIRFIILIILLLITFDVFALTPLAPLANITGIITSGIGFILFLINPKMFIKKVRNFTLLFFLLFLISIIAAYIVYRQSMLSGALASVRLFLVGNVFFMMYLIKKGDIRIEQLIRIIIAIGAIFFILDLVLYMVDIRFLVSSGKFIKANNFQKGIINLSSLLLLSHYFQTKKTQALFFSILLYTINHLGDFQRMIFLIFVMTLSVTLFYYRKKKVMVKFIILFIFLFIPTSVLILSTTSLGILISGKFRSVLELFSDSNTVSSSDVSLGARVLETQFAVESIIKHPVFGGGLIHSSEQSAILGDMYFYISDIGFIGVLFSFGIVGLLLFFKQIKFVISEFRNHDYIKDPSLGFLLFLLFLVLYAFFTGRSVLNPCEFLIPFALIMYYKSEQKQQ